MSTQVVQPGQTLPETGCTACLDHLAGPDTGGLEGPGCLPSSLRGIMCLAAILADPSEGARACRTWASRCSTEQPATGSSLVLCLSNTSRPRGVFGSHRLAQQLLGGCHGCFHAAWPLWGTRDSVIAAGSYQAPLVWAMQAWHHDLDSWSSLSWCRCCRSTAELYR